MDVEDTLELQSAQGLLYRFLNSHGWRMADHCCEHCNMFGFCTTSISVSNIVEMLIVQLVIFRYDPMNNWSRKHIPNLKINDTITSFKKLNIHGVTLDQGASVIVVIKHARLR